jgi:protoporphyrin/coproporphyrin ferrochelatase
VKAEEKPNRELSVAPVPGGITGRTGVLLMAHGAPEHLDEVREFLLNVRGGRRLPDSAVSAISERYASIGGGSPLLRLTKLQAANLQTVLNSNRGAPEAVSSAQPIPVVVGMRNWKPFICDAVRELNGEGVHKVVAICMAPQNSSTSVGLYRKRLDECIAKNAPGMEVDFLESWHDHADLIAAFADKVRQGLVGVGVEAREKIPVIFTAHSVPQKTVDGGDAYKAQVEETASLVARAVGLTGWRVAFQSQGMTEDEWLGPTVESELDRVAGEGNRHVLIAPIGFVSDHVEVLYDIDFAFREYGAKCGLTVWRTESLNDSPLLIRALANLVATRMKAY